MATTSKIGEIQVDERPWSRKGGRPPVEVPPAIKGAVAACVKDGRNRAVILENDAAADFLRLMRIEVRRLHTHMLYTDVTSVDENHQEVRFRLLPKRSK